MKDTFERENRLSERYFLTKFLSEVVFRKYDFEKYKNFGQKVSFKKMIFTFKNIFHKDDFKLQESCLAQKLKKKKKSIF